MERQCLFTSGPQEEGQNITAEYISDTKYYYALGSQIIELPEGQEKKQLKNNKVKY